jgi:hypothetical protein
MPDRGMATDPHTPLDRTWPGQRAAGAARGIRRHRKEPCHAAYLNPWTRSAKDAVVHVCTDVRRHAANPDAGVDPHLRLSPDEAKQQRTEKRAQKEGLAPVSLARGYFC